MTTISTTARVAVATGAALVFLAIAAPGFGQAPTTAPTITRAPAPRTDPTSGSEMFKSYCAACHGARGKGDGPAAPALKVAPSDLTQLSARNQGKFPAAKVAAILQQGSIAAHGSTDMPTWGPVFDALNDKAVTTLRIANLTSYIEGLQGK
jgi:mono/diheme cytochrome c family protein